MNTICWFSGGVTSAVATKLALEKYNNCVIFFCETNQHHEDMGRFIKDCEKWYGQRVIILNNKKAGSINTREDK